MKKLLGIGLCAVSAGAFAADATVSWQLPKKQVDGSAIPASGPDALKSTRIKWSICKTGGAFGTKLGEKEFLMPATSGTISGLDAGKTYCIQALVTNNGGESSSWSNTVSKQIPAEPVTPPKPPTKPEPPILSTTVNVVFRVKEGQITIAGTVALGALCEARTTRAGGTTLNILPAGSGMTLDGKPMKGRVWSICS
jgi:hypothetical protein